MLGAWSCEWWLCACSCFVIFLIVARQVFDSSWHASAAVMRQSRSALDVSDC